MIRFTEMNDLDKMLVAQQELKAEIEALSVSATPNLTGYKRPKSTPEADQTKLKTLKLQLTTLGMKIAAEQAKAAKPAV